MQKLGIIGGMGPLATARLYSLIVECTQAAADQEHFPKVILDYPQIPDRTAYLCASPGAQDFLPTLVVMAHELESLGCTVLAMPCNTAHARYAELSQSLTSATLLNMIAIASQACKERRLERVGLFATRGTLKVGLYQDALKALNIAVVVPPEPVQANIDALIYSYVKKGRQPHPSYLQELLAVMQAEGCDGILLGCTELSTIVWPRVSSLTFVDPLTELAASCVIACDGQLQRG